MKSHDAKIPFYAARASNENWFAFQATNGLARCVLTNRDLEFYDNDSSTLQINDLTQLLMGGDSN